LAGGASVAVHERGGLVVFQRRDADGTSHFSRLAEDADNPGSIRLVALDVAVGPSIVVGWKGGETEQRVLLSTDGGQTWGSS
jgi:hypothetical protein